jgi:nucleotide-binding universal stress UspA family protein
MPFRKILVPLAGINTDSTAIDTALQLSREFEAHIEALYAERARGERARDDAIEPGAFMEVNRVRALFFERCKSYSNERFDNQVANKLSATFLEQQGTEAELIAEHGRVSDLIVFSHPGSSDSDWPSISIQSALRETARPVLIVASPMEQIGKRNVIAWNGSLEAARAIAFAIPILSRGASTLVVTIGNHRVRPSGNEVVDYLKSHGIQSESTVVPIEKSSESSALLAVCLDAGADLIILGAFTRYRTGRPSFGSMTVEMITQNRIPVFMTN